MVLQYCTTEASKCEIAGTHRLSSIAKTPLLSANRQDSVFRRHPESTAVFLLLTYSHCLYRNHVQHCAKGNRVNQLSSKNLAQLREPSFLWHWVLACFTLASNLKFQKRTSISQGSAGRQKSERLAWMIDDSSSHRVKLCHWIGVLITSSIMSNSWQTV